MSGRRKPVFALRPCSLCGNHYTPTMAHQKYCPTRACRLAANRARCNKKSAVEYRRKWRRARMADPEYRADYNRKRNARRRKRYGDDPESRKKASESRRSARAKALAKKRREWRLANDPEYAARVREANRRSEKKRQSDPAKREHMNARKRKAYRRDREKKALLEIARAAALLEQKR